MTTTRATPECYGTLFPDMLHFQPNRPAVGAAFACSASSCGIGTQSVEMTVDRAGWDHCVACPQYRECYDLSLGKLLLSQAMLARA